MRTFCLILLWLLPAIPCAAAGIHLVGAPPLYRLEASGFEGVAAVDITIHYDPATLRIQSLESGPFLQGTLAASSINLPGKARLGAVTTNALHGAGLLATLRVETSGGDIPSLRVEASLRDLDGKSLPVNIDAPLPPAPTPVLPQPATPVPLGEQESAPEPAAAPFPSAVTLVPRSMLTLYPREDGQSTPVHDTSSSPSAPIPLPSAAVAPADRPSVPLARAAKAEKPELGTGSPFALFRQEFASFRTLEDLAQLCALPHGLHQDPCPVLSDGRQTVFLRLEGARQQASFGVQGARLLESWREQNGALHVEMLPAAGGREINIVIVDELLRNIHLLVAPPIKLDPQRSVEDYLARWQDLNGDGIITYAEAWAIAMNLLAARSR